MSPDSYLDKAVRTFRSGGPFYPASERPRQEHIRCSKGGCDVFQGAEG